jgi:hypothetical protein
MLIVESVTPAIKVTPSEGFEIPVKVMTEGLNRMLKVMEPIPVNPVTFNATGTFCPGLAVTVAREAV